MKIVHSLLALGLLLITCPVYAQHHSHHTERGGNGNQPDVSEAVFVHDFSVDMSGAIPAGRTIHVTLTGSPKGTAYFSIPNLLDRAPMKETAPGVYTGQYTTKNDEILNATIFGQLIGKDQTLAPTFYSPNPISIDKTAPKLVNQTPHDHALVCVDRPTIYIGFDDGNGTGIDLKSVQFELDGAPTVPTFVNPKGLSFQPKMPLALGIHTFSIKIADLAGNSAQSLSRFEIQPQTSRPVDSISVNQTTPLSPGDKLTVTAHGQSGMKIDASIAPLHWHCQLKESQPGVYVGMLSAQPGENIDDAALELKIAPKTGDTVFGYPDQFISQFGPKPDAPQITVPGPADGYQGSIEMAGKSQQNMLVQCVVSYDSRSNGGMLPFTGDLLTYTVLSNQKGEWKMGPFPLNIQTLFDDNRDTRINLTATAIDPSGQSSDPTTIRVPYYPQ